MRNTVIAWNRFGLGPRLDMTPPADPRGWLKAQMQAYRPSVPPGESLATRKDILADLAEYRTAQRQTRQARRQSGDPPAKGDAPNPAKPLRQDIRRHYDAQVATRTRLAVASDTPFVERLVHFWANHFAVSVEKLPVLGLAGLMEFEAIRPHVLGRFEGMLMAVVRHPAMLLYLDQAQSIGPDSVVGQRAAARGHERGLNENLGREILELHTLGARAGYSQADVTELARALTGWSVAGLGRRRAQRMMQHLGGAPGDFLFAPPLHEPDARTIMGQRYDQVGEAQARAILTDLARHPATARHIATKLARHFIADDPPAALIARLEQAYRSSNGDLPALYTVLIDSPEAWTDSSAKFRTPWDWAIALLRLQGDMPMLPADPKRADRQLTALFAQLGQPVWRPGSPAGFDDVAASWAGPDALVRRVEVAQRLARRTSPAIDPRAIAEHIFGDTLRPATAQVIARAESPQQGMALLMVAPEMMRR